jgi:hypothetical protein
MRLDSRSQLTPRQGLRWLGSATRHARWTETVAGRWQHAARCATCRGVVSAEDDRHRHVLAAGSPR